jgi:uncharacterized membrane protein YbhN (UPF0104 family)
VHPLVTFVVAGFFGDLGSFFSSLGDVHLVPLLIGMACFVAYLSFRALAFRNILQDAYPTTKVPYLQIWGAYLAAYGFNNVIPARGGDVLKVYLTKTSIPGSSYPTIGAALLVEAIFDLCAGGVAIIFALLAGVFPKPPSWVSLNSVDLSFVAEDGKRALFLVTALVVAILVIFSLVALRVRMFWQSVRQGFAVLRDRRRYLKRVWGVQGVGWLVRGTAFFFLLRAFGLPSTVENVLFVLSANAVAAIFPFTPGGAGVVQALLVELLKGAATGAAIAAYGVGQQATIAVLSLAVGFIALVTIFNIRSFREVIERGRADRVASREAEELRKREASDGDVSGVADTAQDSPRHRGAAPPGGEIDGDVVVGPDGGRGTRGGGGAAGGGGAPTPAPALLDDWLDDVDAAGPPTPRRAGTAPVADPAAARDGSTQIYPSPGGGAVDDWLAEETAPDRERKARREERARWRKRRQRD